MAKSKGKLKKKKKKNILLSRSIAESFPSLKDTQIIDVLDIALLEVQCSTVLLSAKAQRV